MAMARGETCGNKYDEAFTITDDAVAALRCRCVNLSLYVIFTARAESCSAGVWSTLSAAASYPLRRACMAPINRPQRVTPPPSPH